MTFHVPLSVCMQDLIQNSLIIMWLRSSIFYTHQFPGLMFCLYGHGHHTKQEDIYGDGTIYYQVANAAKHQYYIFTITPKGYRYEVTEMLKRTYIQLSETFWQPVLWAGSCSQ